MKGTNIPSRDDREKWPELRELFTKKFLDKTQREWENIFDGTDSCVTPVIPLVSEKNRPIAHLSASPSLAVEDPKLEMLKAGTGTEEVLSEWINWFSGRDYEIDGKGTVAVVNSVKL